MKTSRNGSQNKHKKIFSRYMQEKLAVTVLVITLALFGLAVKLYTLVDEKNEEYTEIVLNQQSPTTAVPCPTGGGTLWTGTALTWPPAKRSTI